MSILTGCEEDISNEETIALHSLFESRLEEYKNRAAVIFKNQAISYNELNRYANQLARCLKHHLGPREEVPSNDGEKSSQKESLLKIPQIIGICLPHSRELIITLLTIMKLGCAYVPLDPDFPRQRMAHVLQQANPLAVITTAANRGNISEAWNGRVLQDVELFSTLENFDGENLTRSEMVDAVDPETASVAVIFTSGSTGLPKGVVLPQRALFNRLRWQWREFPFSENEVCCLKTTLTYVDSVAETFGPLLCGKQLVVIPKEDVINTEEFFLTLEKHRIERLVVVPSLIRSMFLYMRISPQRNHLPDLRFVMTAGEKLPLEMLQEFFQLFPKGKWIANFYGSTEDMADVTFAVFRSPEDVAKKVIQESVPIGVPMTNTSIYLLDEQMKIVPVGELGEIFVSGRNLAQYLHEMKGEFNGDSKYIPNHCSSKLGHSMLYRTGDFGKIVNGTLYYEGRTDGQVKIRGKRVDLSEIETALLNVRGVSQGEILCYRSGKPDQSILAFFQSKDDLLNENQLTNELHRSLMSHMIPLVVKIDEFPLLPNGKIDRQELLRQFEAKSTAKEIIIDLSGIDDKDLESSEVLINVVATVAGVCRQKQLSINQCFFEVGGNSLNVIEAISKLMDKGYAISINDFLQSRSLREIVAKMKPIKSQMTIQGNQNLRSKYYSIPITDIPKEVAIGLTAKSFITKGDLERHTGATVEDFTEFIEKYWQCMVESGFSFGVLDVNDKLVGVSLNSNLCSEPEVSLDSCMQSVLDLLEYAERPCQIMLLEKYSKVMHSVLVGTDEHVTSAENIEIVQFVEEEIQRIARKNNFDAILTTNTSPLTQDMCNKVFNYEILASVKIKDFRDKKGSAVFSAAPDNYCIEVAAKYLN